MEKELSHRQRQILQCIVQHTEAHGYPPTVREIGEAVNLSSSSTVHAHLRSLEDAGLIRRDAVLTRAIRVVAGNIESFKPKRVVNLPLVGRVAAGRPTFADQNIEDTFPVPREFLSGGDGFMLRIKGESMIEDGIMDGDYVIVRRQNAADNGDTVVAMVDDEATVKRLYKDNGRVRLQPANSSMEPMFYDQVEVVGKVVGLIRRMD
ncbi:MAG: transcriptional repressor LexA [Armatimonadetes bacterium]|nr:transcriptional repressor LexA [Armatimonadota bacterium]